MKKRNVILGIALSMLIAAPSAYAQVKKMDKTLSKECKNKIMAYKADHWTLYDNSQSLEMSMLNHYQKLDEGGCSEVSGTASKVISTKAGLQQAKQTACNNFAHTAMSQVYDYVMGDISELNENEAKDFKMFFNAYESIIEKGISNELTPTYTVIHSNGKDESGAETFDMQSYFIVNDSTAAQIRMNAIKEAVSESETAQKFVDKITIFLKETVKAAQ